MSPQVITFKPQRQYKQQIVGESHYQHALEQLAKDYPRRYIDNVELYLEDDNKYDSNAVAVAVEGETIGYLPKDDALKYRQSIERLGYSNAIGTCAGKLTGGGANRNYGFILDLDLDALEVQGHYTMRDLTAKTQNHASTSTAVRKPNKLLLGCLAVLGIACGIFICLVAFGSMLEAINGTPTAGSIVTPPTPLLTSTSPAQPAKTPEEYLAEYGGNLEVYRNILSLTDCVLLQEQFDKCGGAGEGSFPRLHHKMPCKRPSILRICPLRMDPALQIHLRLMD